MKNIVEKWLPQAIETLIEPDVNIADGTNNTVPKQFKGYFASFGAAIVQSGLLPAAVFFSKKGGAEEERQKVTVAILKLLQKQGLALNETELWEHVKNNPAQQQKITHDVLAASSALKLALRVFHQPENDNDL